MSQPPQLPQNTSLPPLIPQTVHETLQPPQLPLQPQQQQQQPQLPQLISTNTVSIPTETWEKTACNRYRIISKEGIAKFGCIYNISRQERPTTREITIYECTSNAPIKKSENAKKNQQKICTTDDTVCVIGDYESCDDPEVLLYKDGDPVYKRKWNGIKDRLTNIRITSKACTVLSYGYYKKDDLCFMVKLHDGINADVWISESWWRKRSGNTSSVIEEPLSSSNFGPTVLSSFDYN